MFLRVLETLNWIRSDEHVSNQTCIACFRNISEIVEWFTKCVRSLCQKWGSNPRQGMKARLSFDMSKIKHLRPFRHRHNYNMKVSELKIVRSGI